MRLPLTNDSVKAFSFSIGDRTSSTVSTFVSGPNSSSKFNSETDFLDPLSFSVPNMSFDKSVPKTIGSSQLLY